MLKYYKDFFSNYENASLIQTLILLAFIIFFVALFYIVWKKPKGYYKEQESAALDIDVEEEENEKNTIK
ncbi:cbb3-type cytochrome c oxidase subunit 3 [Faecalibacter rhinopitheci]|uniref:Cbb3-type cytochrome c oxidase subunit 3 n=1 Tax=Faecalibacter rhinopitheci TaxID=2779678 RepID=A0A8J7K450_9FLAO|nr:cbb3-type cytochrome c oxidase subunit 3 [Faecalibacter rhinopitheci]MBF0597034.1 cbb3-type cytochrome c oxidase subunit 3 [Faecalibacter rhinopitheci]MBQ0147703.1 cbb3-type cytochrome c oxidase subunit 3 [Candidatus Onthonaster equi]